MQDCDQCIGSGGHVVECSPIWRIANPELRLGGITCLNCFLTRQECSYWTKNWPIKRWPTVVETAVGRALRENTTGPNDRADGMAHDHEICVVLRHLNVFEEHLQDPAETVVSLQTHRAKLREIQRQEEHEAAALHALVDDRKPIFERLVQMFDQAIESRGQEATNRGPNVEGEQGGGERQN